MSKINLRRNDIGRISDFLTKFNDITAFTLVEECGAGIGSTLHIEVDDEENGFNVTKKYEITGVEDW